jgi:alpha-tubulin suppressor-like RCC1 family protein
MAATKTDGTLWAWGSNNNGQLGLGNQTYYSSPKQIGALTSWLNISAGRYSLVAIKSDGTLWAWGANDYGQLGLSNKIAYSSPKQVGALTNWSKSGSGTYHNIALKTDSTLWSWGYNDHGQLGQNNTSNLSSPKQIGSLTNWKSVNLFNWLSSTSAAITTTNNLYVWGDNYGGQLGLSNGTDYSSPKQVGSLSTWSTASIGNRVTIAVG